MRRLSHNEDWGFTPVLHDKPLYPKQFPFSLPFNPTGLKDWLQGRSLDVVIGRQKITVVERSFTSLVKGRLKRTSYAVSDYIGVAVQYCLMPEAFPPLSFAPQSSMMPYLSDAFAARSFQLPPREAVSVYLMHENSSRDVLLYHADHEDEILAQWQFWSQRLSLPCLLVGPDGFVDEPHDRLGAVVFTKSSPRSKQYGLYGRRPVFSRVRDMGDVSHASACYGREIMARD